MTNPDGSEYIGAVWPGYTVFPDWLSPNASSYWVDEIRRYHQNIPFSGIWIDMSEASFQEQDAGDVGYEMMRGDDSIRSQTEADLGVFGCLFS